MSVKNSSNMDFRNSTMDELIQKYPYVRDSAANPNQTRHQISARKHYHAKREQILANLALKNLAQHGKIPYKKSLARLDLLDVICAWCTYNKNNTLECHTKHRRSQVEHFQAYLRNALTQL